jgi:hypothetical protein
MLLLQNLTYLVISNFKILVISHNKDISSFNIFSN